jgi:DNA-binding YbaB/EbfC family protein
MFDKMKMLLDAQKKMKEMKRQLEATSFTVSSADGLITITMSGTQEVKEVRVKDEVTTLGKADLEKAMADVYNRALKRSQEIAAEKMKDITGFQLPGLS